MLVLARKVGQRIVVPDLALIITVLECRGNTVRLGVAAPDDVGVYREELWRRIDGAETSRRRQAPPPPPANDVQPAAARPIGRGGSLHGDRKHGLLK